MSVTLVNETSKSGRLYSVSSYQRYLKITIDGVIVYNGRIYGGINFGLRGLKFKTSLKVEVSGTYGMVSYQIE